jgi:hypothetical protein
MAALAAYTDCEVRWGVTLTEDEIAQVNALLEDASALILDVADLDAPWTSATVPAALLPVVCEAARRAFDNPAGLQGETIGSYTWRAGVVTASGVYLTADEKRAVRRAAGRLGVGTVTLTTDLPLPSLEGDVAALFSDDGYIVVNAPEPAE